MSDPAYESWKRDRLEAPVPEGFADRVLEVQASGTAREPSPPAWGGVARAALVLLGVGALLFRMGSTLVLVLSR